jgi:hypothetical protein
MDTAVANLPENMSNAYATLIEAICCCGKQVKNIPG